MEKYLQIWETCLVILKLEFTAQIEGVDPVERQDDFAVYETKNQALLK